MNNIPHFEEEEEYKRKNMNFTTMTCVYICMVVKVTFCTLFFFSFSFSFSFLKCAIQHDNIYVHIYIQYTIISQTQLLRKYTWMLALA